MNALVLQHPHLTSQRPPPRLATQSRRLHAEALWSTIGRDQSTGLQNFTPALVQEFHGLVDGLQSRRPRGAIPNYAVVQSADPGYFSMAGDLRFFRDCIQRRDASTLRAYAMRFLELLLSWDGGIKATTPTIALVHGRRLGGAFASA